MNQPRTESSRLRYHSTTLAQILKVICAEKTMSVCNLKRYKVVCGIILRTQLRKAKHHH